MNPATLTWRIRSASVAGLLVACALGAHATNTNTQVSMAQTAVRTVTASYGSTSQTWREWANAGLFPSQHATSPLGNVLATTRHKGPSPIVGEVIDVDVKRNLPWAKISRAVAKSLPLISTAVAIAEIAEAIRCREAPGGGSECDPGQDESLQQVWCTASDGTGSCGSSPAAALAPVFAAAEQVWINGWGSLPAGWSIVSGPGAANCVQQYETEYYCQGTQKRVLYPGGSQAGSNQPSGTAWRVSKLACAPVVVNGVTLYPTKGPDGKCMTNVYEPATEEAVSTKAETYGDKSKAPAIVGDLLNGGTPIDHPFPEIDPVPTSINGPRETTSHPDGSTTTRDTRYDFGPTPNGYGWTPAVTTKEWAPGVTPTLPGEVEGGTTTSGGTAPEQEIITCGLPTTPPCKIDEGGTPPPDDPFEPNPGSWFDPLRGVFDNPPVADTSWTWAFSLPTGCTPMEVGPFMGHTVNVDPCQWQPMIHDLMAVIWLCTGVWICIGMVGRTISGT